jgi:hypothetical protein
MRSRGKPNATKRRRPARWKRWAYLLIVTTAAGGAVWLLAPAPSRGSSCDAGGSCLSGRGRGVEVHRLSSTEAKVR